MWCPRCLHLHQESMSDIALGRVKVCANCEEPFSFTTDYDSHRLVALLDRRLRITDEDHAALVAALAEADA